MNDELLGSYYAFRDVTQLTDGDEHAGMARVLDSLTGLYNWEGFREKARRYLARYEGADLMLIRINVKEFTTTPLKATSKAHISPIAASTTRHITC